MSKSSKYSQLKSYVQSRPGTPTWEVRSTTTYPTFCGEVTEAREESRHGGYTTEELFRYGCFFDGWAEAGYVVAGWEQEEEGPIVANLKNGPIAVRVELLQYA